MLGIGLGLSVALSSPVELQPSQIFKTKMKCNWRADNVTLDSAMRSTGTVPPAVTLSGSLSSPRGIQIECTTTGVRGVAVVKYSLDNGASYTTGVTTAATVALGSSGITANFPTGTYTNDDVWKAITATLTDRSGNSNDGAHASAADEPVYLDAASTSALNGHPGLLYDGRLTQKSFTLVQPQCVIAVFTPTTSGTPGTADLYYDGFTNLGGTLADDTTNGTYSYAGAVASWSPDLSSGTPSGIRVFYNAGASYASLNGTSATTATTGTNNMGGLTWGGGGNGGRRGVSKLYEVMVLNASPTNAEIAELNRYLVKRYANGVTV